MAPCLSPAPARFSHFLLLNDFPPPSRSLEQAIRTTVRRASSPGEKCECTCPKGKVNMKFFPSPEYTVRNVVKHVLELTWKLVISNYSTSVRWTMVGYNHLISNKREWNNCFIKNARKYREFFPTLFVKTTDFHLVFNFEQTRTVDIFGEHSIMANIP